MEIYSMTKEQLELEMTKAINAFCEHLADEGIIKEVLSEELQKTRIAVIRKPSSISKLFRNLMNKEGYESDVILIARVDDIKTDR